MKSFFCVLGLLLVVSAHAGNARLSFVTSDTAKIYIAKPIDGMPNWYFYQDTVYLYPDKKNNYNISTDDVTILYLKHPRRFYSEPVYIYPDADIRLHLTKGGLKVNDVKSSVCSYLGSVKFSQDVYRYSGQLRDFLQSRFENKKIFRDVLDSIPHFSVPKEIGAGEDSCFVNLLGEKITYNERLVLVDLLKEFSLTPNLSREDSMFIRSSIDSVYHSFPPDDRYYKYCDKAISAYSISYYYDYVWSGLSTDEKENLQENYDVEAFGEYCIWLAAPPVYRLYGLRQAFLNPYRIGSFDEKKMLGYLYDKYPNTETYRICKYLYDEKKQDTLIWKKKPIHSLKEMSQLPELKGKFVVVDLWATWCVPCRFEMPYFRELQKYIDRFRNVVLVYLSIDDDANIWEKEVRYMFGIQLRASKRLQDELKGKVEPRNAVPRYFLLDPSGGVINKNLERPSNDIEKLKKQIREGREAYLRSL